MVWDLLDMKLSWFCYDQKSPKLEDGFLLAYASLFVGQSWVSWVASLYLSLIMSRFQNQKFRAHISGISKNQSNSQYFSTYAIAYYHFLKQRNIFFNPNKMIKLENLTKHKDRKCKRPVDFLPWIDVNANEVIFKTHLN